jgi:hypothetical protein
MAYRVDERSEPLETASMAGKLRLEVGAQDVRLMMGGRSLVFADRFATLIEHKKRDRRSSWRLDGRVVVARDVPRYDLGVWVETPEGMLRIFEAVPPDLLAANGLAALRSFDRVAQKLRASLKQYAASVESAVEVGRGLDKVLLVETEVSLHLFVRPLFRDRARLVISVNRDGEVRLVGTKAPVHCESRFGVTVQGDYIKFFDRHGTDLARIALPWIMPEDRREIARRIGDLVERDRQPLAFAVNAF